MPQAVAAAALEAWPAVPQAGSGARASPVLPVDDSLPDDSAAPQEADCSAAPWAVAPGFPPDESSLAGCSAELLADDSAEPQVLPQADSFLDDCLVVRLAAGSRADLVAAPRDGSLVDWVDLPADDMQADYSAASEDDSAAPVRVQRDAQRARAGLVDDSPVALRARAGSADDSPAALRARAVTAAPRRWLEDGPSWPSLVSMEAQLSPLVAPPQGEPS